MIMKLFLWADYNLLFIVIVIQNQEWEGRKVHNKHIVPKYSKDKKFCFDMKYCL